MRYARCKIHEELADAKAENDALRDDVAAGRRRLHIKAVYAISAWSHHLRLLDNAASPLAELSLLVADYFCWRGAGLYRKQLRNKCIVKR